MLGLPVGSRHMKIVEGVELFRALRQFTPGENPVHVRTPALDVPLGAKVLVSTAGVEWLKWAMK